MYYLNDFGDTDTPLCCLKLDAIQCVNDSFSSLQIFEKGIKAIPVSIELWIHYINFYIAEFGKSDTGEENIRK